MKEHFMGIADVLKYEARTSALVELLNALEVVEQDQAWVFRTQVTVSMLRTIMAKKQYQARYRNV